MIGVPPVEIIKQAFVIALIYTMVDAGIKAMNLVPLAEAVGVPINFMSTFASTMVLWFLLYWFGLS